MSEEEGTKAWMIPLGLLIFCGLAVLLASVITMSMLEIPAPAYGPNAAPTATGQP
jgi:hypothetical protein